MRLIYASLMAVLAAMLSGCAGPVVDGAIEFESIGNRGVVIVSATHDEETGSRANTIFCIDSSLDRRLLRSQATSNDPGKRSLSSERGSVYVLAMSPGTHQLDGWQTTGGPFRLLPKAALPPLRFTVKAGEVVYVGNLHMSNVLGRPNVLSPWVPVAGTPEVRDRHEIDIAIAEEKAPAIKGKVVSEVFPLGTWGPSYPETRRNDEPFRLPPPLPPKK